MHFYIGVRELRMCGRELYERIERGCVQYSFGR